MTLREKFKMGTGKQYVTEEMQNNIVIANYTCDYVHWLESKLNASVLKIEYMSSYQKGFDDGANAASNDILSN